LLSRRRKLILSEFVSQNRQRVTLGRVVESARKNIFDPNDGLIDRFRTSLISAEGLKVPRLPGGAEFRETARPPIIFEAPNGKLEAGSSSEIAANRIVRAIP
jgi:hypothetical protein